MTWRQGEEYRTAKGEFAADVMSYIVITVTSFIILYLTSLQEDVTPLDEYVHSDDGAYGWEFLDTIRYDEWGVTVYLLNMTSQRWLTGRPSEQHRGGTLHKDKPKKESV